MGILILFPILLLVFAPFWIKYFIGLMLLPDDCFPGKYDKVVWGLAFVFVFPLAPIAFPLWQQTYLDVKKEEARGF